MGDLRTLLRNLSTSNKTLGALETLKEFLLLIRDKGAWAPTIAIDVKLAEVLQEGITTIGSKIDNMSIDLKQQVIKDNKNNAV